MRAPLAPMGCPRAMAPPLILTFSISQPKCRFTAMAWDDECLVGLDQVKVADLHTRLGQGFFRGRNGAGSHDAWIYAAGGIRYDTGQGRDASLVRVFLGHDHEAGRAIVDTAGVTGGHGAVFFESGRYLGHAFDSGAEPGMFVRIKGNGVFFPLGNDHGDDFFGKPAFLDGGLGLVLAGHGKGILFLAGDARIFRPRFRR